MHNEGYRDDRSPSRGAKMYCVAADLLKDLGHDTLTSTTRLNLLLFELFTFAFTFGSRAPTTPFTSQVQDNKCQKSSLGLRQATGE